MRSWRIGVALFVALALQAQERLCEPLQRAGRDAMNARQYLRAAEQFGEAFDACPEKRSLLLEQAQAYTSARSLDEAIRTAQRYLSGDAGSIPGRLVLANAYLLAQRVKDALAESEAILRDHPDEPAALKVKANAAYLGGDFPTARDTFIRLLDRHPDDEDGAYMLGRIYYQESYLDLAAGQFERVLKLNPSSYKALDNLGLCYQALGDNEKATRYFLAAIKQVETDHVPYEWPYANLADLLLKNDDPQRAYDAAAKAANLNPMSARSFCIGAKALERLGKTELSLNWLQRAVSIDPQMSEAWYVLARVYRKLNQNDQAQQAQQKFLELTAQAPPRRR
jgi:tetratricopeptide (TPR) repeat protein